MLRKLFFLLLVSVSGIVYGQHLARVCVIDMARVYQESSRDSRAVREFEQRSKNVQEEVDKRQKAINELKEKHAAALENENQSEANRLQNQINTQTESLRDYYNRQTAQLEQQRARLLQSNSFLSHVQEQVRLVAEGEGFSIVIDRSNRNSGVMWSSPTVDITDKVIQALRER